MSLEPDDQSFATQPDDDDEPQALMASTESDDDEASVSLLERRARNVERNQDLLARLGMDFGAIRPKKKRKTAPVVKESVEPQKAEAEPPRGMLLATPSSSLSTDFPFRQAQIRKLQALLEHSCVPILVSGPGGTGKTAVVQACIRSHVHAYVDCAALDAPSMMEVTRSAYHQLVRQFARNGK